MPRGAYRLSDRVEAFSCAPGPVGWRYVSDRLDLACESAWRAVRFVVTSPTGGSLRGGGARLDDGTPVLIWARTAEQPETVTRADALLTASPGSWVALCRLVAGPAAEPVQRDLSVLVVEASSLAAVRTAYRLTRVGAQGHEAPAGRLLVEVWHLDDLASGRRAVVHLAGDVVVHASGLLLAGDEAEVSHLDGPPSTAAPRPARQAWPNQPETGR